MKEKISERIKYKRKSAGLTQAELGKKVGVSDVTILRWERGERTPNSSILPNLAEALNTSVEYLMGLTDDTPPEQPLRQLLENLSKSLPIKENNQEKVKITDPLFGTQWEYDPNKPQELDMSYWGSVLDNMRRLAKSEAKHSDVALIIAMLKNGIEELINSKGNKNQSTAVVMNNLNGDNMNVNVNHK